MKDDLSIFLEALTAAASDGTLVKCTLSHPAKEAPPGLKNIFIRLVNLKKGLHLAFTFHYQTRDEVKNLTPSAARDNLSQWIGPWFRNADLFNTNAHWNLQIRTNGATSIRKMDSAHQGIQPDTSHDRKKKRRIDPSAPWLHALGITNKHGEVLPSAQDKWKQINKYLEIIEGLLQRAPLPPGAHVADMGSGKGYLTFALYEFLSAQPGLNASVSGIELRQPLVDLCNRIAAENGFDRLQFLAKNIADYLPDKLDMLIALHACDTATDLAISTGILQKASIIVAAPCCHKQIRKDMNTQNELSPILQHGILEERQAEIITDGIRALLLEQYGYATKVFEFVSTEHTAKNLMITATRRQAGNQNPAAADQIKALKTGFGIPEHYLETLLKKHSPSEL